VTLAVKGRGCGASYVGRERFFIFWHPVKYCIIKIFLKFISVMYMTCNI